MKKRSPVKLVCERPYLDVGDDMRICRWTCPTGGGTVQFRDRQSPRHFAILHKSTKQRGKFQVTHFDERGAVSDVIRGDCETALRDGGIDQNWKIEAIGELGRARRRR